MAEDSSIEWTHHTFNPWWGCTKVSAGCKHCYAETLSNRFGNNWGPNAPRKFMSDANWRKPIAWNRKAGELGERHRVFCASMADVFEVHHDSAINMRMDMERDRLWKLIEETPHLDWLLLTKRPENHELVSLRWQTGSHPTNVWLGISVENQEQARNRVGWFWQIRWAAKKFLSCEPLLGAVDLRWATRPLDQVDWVICGAESGSSARPMRQDWVRALRDQCKEHQVAFFYKQRLEDGKKISLPLLDGVRHAEFPLTKG